MPASRKILIIDDNADAAKTTQMLLSMLGHEAEVAFDGPSGIDMAASSAPDVILLDIGLPGMDGYEVARRLREKTGQKETLLIALSGHGEPDDVQKAKEAGFDHHLVKPADTARLMALIAQ